jgi:hypothetical protein
MRNHSYLRAGRQTQEEVGGGMQTRQDQLRRQTPPVEKPSTSPIEKENAKR